MVNSIGFARRAVAGVATAAILATQLVTAPFAAAQSAEFSDVPSDHFAHDYIYELVDMGIVSGNPDGTFRPNAYLNRAEMAKIAVKLATISGVIADAEDLSNAPSFSDVSSDAWFYGYVSAAAKNGIFEGYRDAAGNLTGMFGASDTVLRAQAAKVLMIAAGVPTKMTPAAPFVDVNPSDWFYGYVTSAYNWSILDGYKDAAGNLTGYFGPADPVTRGQISKIAVNAQAPVDRYNGTTPDMNSNTNMSNMNTNSGTGSNMNSNVPMSNASFEAALSSSTPTGMTLATGTAFNTVAKLDLTAGNQEDVKVTAITMMHRGISPDSIVNGVLVIDKDGARHGNIVSFSDSKAMVDFSANPIVVAKGTTHTISLQTNFNVPVGSFSGTYKVEVPANGMKAYGVSTGGLVNVMGSFPIGGPEYSLVAGTNIGNVTFDDVVITSATQDVDLGVTNKEVAKFKITQANSQEDLELTELTLFNNGNTSDTDIKNIKLIAQDGTVLSTVAATANRYVTFALATPYIVPKGTSRNVSVMVDVINGSTRTVQFVVSNDYDLKIKGKTSQAFLLPTAGTSDTSFPIGDTAGRNTIMVKEGTLTVSKATSSPSGEVSRGGTDVVIAEFKVEAAGEDIEIQGGTVKATTAAQANLKGTFKIVNGSGTTLHSVNATEVAQANFFNGTGVNVPRFNNFFTVKAGTTGSIKLVVDVADAATAGNTFLGAISNLNIKKLSSNRTSTAATTEVTGNTMSITAANLTVAKNSAFGDQNLVKGATSQKLGSLNLTTTNAEGVSVSSLVINLSSNSGVTNLKLMKDGAQLGSTIATPGTTSNTFSVSGQLSILKASSATVDVIADVASSSAATSIIASVATGGISATGLTSSNSLTNVPAAQVDLQTNSVVSSGSATIASTSATASSMVLNAGQTGVNLFTFSVKAANNEDMRLERAKVAFGNGQSTVSNVELYDGTTKIAGPLTLTNGVADFSGFQISIAKNTTKNLWVKASVNSGGSLESDTEVVAGLYYYELVGQSSGIRSQRFAGTELVGTDTAETYSVNDLTFNQAGAFRFVNVAGTGAAASAQGIALAGQVSNIPTTTSAALAGTSTEQFVLGQVVAFATSTTGAVTIGAVTQAGTAALDTTAGVDAGEILVNNMQYRTANFAQIARIPTKSIEVVSGGNKYFYALGDVLVVNRAGVVATEIVTTAGTSATAVTNAAALSTATVISALPTITTSTTINSTMFDKGDVVVTNAGAFGVVTAVTTTTVSINGGVTAATRLTKIFSARGVSKNIIVEDTKATISVASVTPDNTQKAEGILGALTITASGSQDIALNTIKAIAGGSYDSSTGAFVTSYKLYDGATLVATGTTANAGRTGQAFADDTVTFTFGAGVSGYVINAGVTKTLTIKADTNNIRLGATTNPVSFSLQIAGTSATRDANNGLTYTYVNAKSTPITITTSYAGEYPLSTQTISFQ